MNTEPKNAIAPHPEANIKELLDWLSLAHGRTGAEDVAPLHRHLLLLREIALPPDHRTKLLDLFYSQVARLVSVEIPKLREISLPISRKLRLHIKQVLDLLAALTQDYFNSLAELFDPESNTTPHLATSSLRRAMHAIAWQVKINHLLASPTGVGLWQQLHSALHTARRLGVEHIPGARGGPGILRIYTNTLLAAIAQPASFSSIELAFISDYIDQNPLSIELLDFPPIDGTGVFWIDLDKDFPAHALTRRTPTAEAKILYFSCDALARQAVQHKAMLDKGMAAAALGLPVFADSDAGRGVLQRLNLLWGHPAKRRFPRRRQSYRASLCSGLEQLWHLIKAPDNNVEFSEWMVTNESPDGYALMHISGHMADLSVGDIVALKATGEPSKAPTVWQICIIRWAISENPEHVELGLQLIASRALAAEIIQPEASSEGKIAALILPETPPLRQLESLVVPVGALKDTSRRIILLIENNNLEVREIRATGLDERTNSIEVFNVSSDDSA